MANEFFQHVAHGFSRDYLAKRVFFNAFRGIPFERMSYGLFYDAISAVHETEFVLTECPVSRCAELSLGEKGRVDFIAYHKGWVFVIEAKSIGVRTRSRSADVPAKVDAAFSAVVGQLDRLNLESQEWLQSLCEIGRFNRHFRGVVKMPVLVINYRRASAQLESLKMTDMSSDIHEQHKWLTRQLQPAWSAYVADPYEAEKCGKTRNGDKFVILDGFGFLVGKGSVLVTRNEIESLPR